MSLSHYFEDLSKAYKAELEDLQTDSEGNDVLAKRLKEKRSQFAALLPMIETAPEMVAVVFHGELHFDNLQAMYNLSLTEPDEFPDWEAIVPTLQLSTRMEPLVAQALAAPGGECFMLTVACLEYLHANSGKASRSAQGDDSDEHDEGENGRSDDDDERDLDEAGADWMTDQGFDKRE
jgi:hypothetical protein